MLDALVRILVSLTRSSQVEPVRELRTDFFSASVDQDQE